MSTCPRRVELDRRIPLPIIAGYLELTEAERAAVQQAMEEAAALDQLESRGVRRP